MERGKGEQMTCDEMQLEISAYIDNALGADAQGMMFAHLGTCPACRSFLRGILEVRHRVASIPAPDVPEGLDRRVLKQPSPRPPGRTQGVRGRIADFWTQRLSVPAPSAALVALALIVITIFSLSLLRRPDEVPLPCLPVIDVYLEQPTAPANSQQR
jgi:anti-sigma factor RsiW